MRINSGVVVFLECGGKKIWVAGLGNLSCNELHLWWHTIAMKKINTRGGHEHIKH